MSFDSDLLSAPFVRVLGFEIPGRLLDLNFDMTGLDPGPAVGLRFAAELSALGFESLGLADFCVFARHAAAFAGCLYPGELTVLSAGIWIP